MVEISHDEIRRAFLSEGNLIRNSDPTTCKIAARYVQSEMCIFQQSGDKNEAGGRKNLG